MGAIYRLDIQSIIDKYNLVNYVETGTGQAICLRDALKYNFRNFFSVEIHEKLFTDLQSQSFPSNVNLINNNSVDGLKSIFAQLDPDENCLFWLDAHFANASDFQQGNYLDCIGNNNLNFPLERELELIKQYRNGRDVIICDDVRIYQDGPFTGGNWDIRASMEIGDLSFAYKLFDQTHDLKIDYLDQGYLFIEPKI